MPIYPVFQPLRDPNNPRRLLTCALCGWPIDLIDIADGDIIAERTNLDDEGDRWLVRHESCEKELLIWLKKPYDERKLEVEDLMKCNGKR